MKKATNNKLITSIKKAILRKPKTKRELVELLRELTTNSLLDDEALNMLRGVLAVSEIHARDIMIPRSQMEVIKITSTLKEAVTTINSSGHSRFPVVGDNRDEVIGLLLAKDLLQYSFDKSHEKEFKVQNYLRPALFIPESKRLNILLKEFRLGHHHMAIVVDEYGSIAGLITIEDVLEEIVGEIEDEYDVDTESYITKLYDNNYSVKGLTPIETFNDYFNVALSDKEFDTIGGLVTQKFERVPKKGEETMINDFHFKVLHATKRKINLLSVQTK